MGKKTIIIIPTFNESMNIEGLVKKINEQNIDLDILVVDDDSPDGTSDIVFEMQKVLPNLKLITKTEDKGFAKAYITGFNYAIDNGYDIVVQMDADGSHQPKFLKSMLNAVERNDYVIGSRWIKGGSVVNWPLKRFILSRGGNMYARIMLNSNVKDITGGHKAISIELLKKMDVNSITSKGYSFQIELYLRARANGAKVVEVPIEFVEREQGVSKMSSDIVKEAMLFVTKKGLLRK
jgi:dolichol-phosphate mannosyltransferase